MSVKIYNGVRFPAKHLNAFLSHVYESEHNDMLAHIKRLIKFEKPATNDDEFVELYSRWNTIEGKLDEGKGIWSWNSGWVLWLDDNLIYAYPYGLWGETRFKSNVEELSFVENFAYWDNSDKPKAISLSEWHNRRDTWKRLRDRFDTRLVFETTTFGENKYRSSGYILAKLEML